MGLVEDRKKYYEYNPEESGEWWVKNPPPRDLDFEKGLLRIGGTHGNGKPILRVVWGGTEMHDITETPNSSTK